MDKRTAITAFCATIAIFASTQAQAEGTIIFGQRGKNLEQALHAAKKAPGQIITQIVDTGKSIVKGTIEQLFQPIRVELGHFAFLDAPLFTIEYSIPTNSAQVTANPVHPKETPKPAAKQPITGLYGSILKS